METPAETRTAVTEATTICQAFWATAESGGDRVALRSIGDDIRLTWSEYSAQAALVAAGLQALGLRRGDRVGLMLVNRPEFNLADTGAMLAGATCFSIYNTSSPEQIAYLLGDAENRILVTERRFLAAVKGSGVDLDQIVLVDADDDEAIAEGAIGWDRLLALGADSEVDPRALSEEVEPADVLCLIYTSGTTGPPKGVQLTHANLIAEAEAFYSVGKLDRGSRTVSFLPSAHIGDRFFTYYSSIVLGLEVTTCPDMNDLVSHLVDSRPQWIATVPRIWEKLRVAIEAHHSGQAEDADFAAARAAVGLDCLELACIGGVASSVELIEAFAEIGIELLELWGMSETAATATLNPPGASRPGSVGTALPGVDVRVGADGELFVRGPVTTIGYRNRPADTAELFDADGWLASGDLARIDDDGYVYIVGRKKEIMINAAGKNMSPANIETALRSGSPVIGHVCAIGERRRYNTALVVLDVDRASAIASSPEAAGDPARLAVEPAVLEAVAEGVRIGNERLSRVEQVRRWRVLPVEWLPSSDELTPTLKLKRSAVLAKYVEEIEDLYR